MNDTRRTLDSLADAVTDDEMNPCRKALWIRPATTMSRIRYFCKAGEFFGTLRNLRTLAVAGLCAVVIWSLACAADPVESQGQESYALIYNGPVAAEECPEAVADIAAQLDLPARFIADIAELPDLLEDAAVFVIGGTEDDLYPLIDAFTPDVMAALVAYLRSGGRFWGICGGGFLASTGWYEADDTFVEMLGIIPAESADFDEEYYEPQIVSINWRGAMYPMYFQAAPMFELLEREEDVDVIAYYDDGSIAALISSYGDGKVAVVGPHPEAPQSWSEEAEDGEDWVSTTDLAVALLQELLSDNPVTPE